MPRLLLLLLLPVLGFGQSTDYAKFKDYPFSNELCASPQGAQIAWAMNEQGRRNIYVAEAPDFTPRMVTQFMKDDGQELSSLSITADGKWVIFVRGGDHGANWDDGLPINPRGDINPFKVQVGFVPFKGGPVKYFSEGDEPAVSKNNTVAFIKSGQVWLANPDSATPAKLLFTAHGNQADLQWSPDGKTLLFVSRRVGHSILGMIHPGDSTVKWISPAFSRDGSPRWSPDGNKIVFVRQPVQSGKPDSLLVRHNSPWSLYTTDTSGGAAVLLWKAPATLAGSFPSIDGNVNLHWAAGNKIVFLSYHDGWPHLYSLDAGGGKEKLLTPGNFMCEHIKISSDGTTLVCSANTGQDKLDIDRRHIVSIDIQQGSMQVLTPGSDMQWMPVITGDKSTIGFIGANAQKPPLPAILKTSDKMIVPLCDDHIPADFPQSQLVTPRQVILTSADGLPVHAQVFEKNDGKTKKPAIVYIHGGPQRQMLLGWNYSDYYANAYSCNQYLASLGFVVISVNYRLGIGYGYNFHMPPHAGVRGASEYLDIRAAAEWLAKQPNIDPKRIGVYGGSYGGYLTAMALGKDSRLFAAGVDIHGVHDWVGRANMLTMYDNTYEKAPDYAQALKTGWLSSPLAWIDNWKSPVLIIHGDDDRNVAFVQSLDLISRLEKKGVPYETLMIVDDTHHWMSFANAVKAYGAAADYFVRKLKP